MTSKCPQCHRKLGDNDGCGVCLEFHRFMQAYNLERCYGVAVAAFLHGIKAQRSRPQPAPLDWYADVRAFHEKFGCFVGRRPEFPGREAYELRRSLVREEYYELSDAMEADDIPQVADAMADLIYVVLGTAIAYGIDLRPIFAAIHAANMAKIGGAKRDDGKILKPAGWKHPDIAQLLEAQTIAARHVANVSGHGIEPAATAAVDVTAKGVAVAGSAPPLDWTEQFDDHDRPYLQAASCIHDDGLSFVYRIEKLAHHHCYSIAKTTPEMLGDTQTQYTAQQEAKDACQRIENQAVAACIAQAAAEGTQQ